jgi:plastocyanin
MRGRRAARVAAVAPLLLALVPAAGCGSRKAESEQIFAQGPLPYRSAFVRVIDNRFRPSEIQARPDEPMLWFNQGKAEHTATADSGQQITFDTGTIEPGKRKQVRLKVPGTWTYHCRFHPFMKGRIQVVK